MTIIVDKRLTKNQEIVNSHFEFCPISGEWGSEQYQIWQECA